MCELSTILMGVGAASSVVGTMRASSAAAADTANELAIAQLNARLLSDRSTTEKILTATADERSRESYRREIARQGAELAARGIDLSSPTAVHLGETAAREMAFESQAIRQEGAATQSEIEGQQASLSLSQQQLKARRKNQLLTGNFTAAEKLLTAAPEIWPELLA